MMGAVAKAARAGGARTIGVIPEVFANDNEFTSHDKDAHELIVCKSMKERKAHMQALSDGFIVLPGGIGTLEELFEGCNLEVLCNYNSSAVAECWVVSLCGFLFSVGWSLFERAQQAHRHRRPSRVRSFMRIHDFLGASFSLISIGFTRHCWLLWKASLAMDLCGQISCEYCSSPRIWMPRWITSRRKYQKERKGKKMLALHDASAMNRMPICISDFQHIASSSCSTRRPLEPVA